MNLGDIKLRKSRSRMLRILTVSFAGWLPIAGSAPLLAAGSEADFKTAYAAAEASNQEASRLRNQWTTTAAVLADAKKAAAAAAFDRAIALAQDADALAKASIDQANSEKEAWKAIEVR